MHYVLKCEKPILGPMSLDLNFKGNVGLGLDEGEFCDWIATASSGKSIEYHRGFLLSDRSGANGAYSIKDQQRISALARRAWIGAELGLLHLYSERLGEAWYRYVAVRANTTLRLSA